MQLSNMANIQGGAGGPPGFPAHAGSGGSGGGMGGHGMPVGYGMQGVSPGAHYPQAHAMMQPGGGGAVGGWMGAAKLVGNSVGAFARPPNNNQGGGGGGGQPPRSLGPSPTPNLNAAAAAMGAAGAPGPGAMAAVAMAANRFQSNAGMPSHASLDAEKSSGDVSYDVSHLSTRNARLEDKLAKALTKNRAMAKYYDQLLAKMKETHATEVETKNRELTSAKEEILTLRGTTDTLDRERREREDMARELSTMRHAEARLRDEITRLGDSLSSEQNRVREKDDEIAEARRRLQDAQADVGRAERERDAAKHAVELAQGTQQGGLAGPRGRSLDADDEVAELRELLASVRAERDAQRAKDDALSVQLSAIKEQALERIEENARVTKELAAVSSQLARAEAERDASQRELASTKERANVDDLERRTREEAFQRKLDSAAESRDSAMLRAEEYASAADKLKESERARMLLSEQVASLNGKLEEMSDRFVLANQEKEILIRHSAKATALEARTSELHAEVSTAINERNSLRVRLDHATASADRRLERCATSMRKFCYSASRSDTTMADNLRACEYELGAITQSTVKLVSVAERDAAALARLAIEVIRSSRSVVKELGADVVRLTYEMRSTSENSLAARLAEAHRFQRKTAAELEASENRVAQVTAKLRAVRDVSREAGERLIAALVSTSPNGNWEVHPSAASARAAVLAGGGETKLFAADGEADQANATNEATQADGEAPSDHQHQQQQPSSSTATNPVASFALGAARAEETRSAQPSTTAPDDVAVAQGGAAALLAQSALRDRRRCRAYRFQLLVVAAYHRHYKRSVEEFGADAPNAGVCTMLRNQVKIAQLERRKAERLGGKAGAGLRWSLLSERMLRYAERGAVRESAAAGFALTRKTMQLDLATRERRAGQQLLAGKEADLVMAKDMLKKALDDRDGILKRLSHWCTRVNEHVKRRRAYSWAERVVMDGDPTSNAIGSRAPEVLAAGEAAVDVVTSGGERPLTLLLPSPRSILADVRGAAALDEQELYGADRRARSLAAEAADEEEALATSVRRAAQAALETESQSAFDAIRGIVDECLKTSAQLEEYASAATASIQAIAADPTGVTTGIDPAAAAAEAEEKVRLADEAERAIEQELEALSTREPNQAKDRDVSVVLAGNAFPQPTAAGAGMEEQGLRLKAFALEAVLRAHRTERKLQALETQQMQQQQQMQVQMQQQMEMQMQQDPLASMVDAAAPPEERAPSAAPSTSSRAPAAKGKAPAKSKSLAKAPTRKKR